ncbi:MAG: Endonuclease/exonuclease/phosphatase [Acidobacteria bacterium]|nr:Endonuclease/exonuclease/phosphatase [Acidobacteriota bacterium]
MTITGCGGAAPASPSAAAGTRSNRAPITVKVMTFNIQHGIDAKGRYNLQRAIDVVARVQPDIVGLQEVTRNHPSYVCDDQPDRIAAGLKTATGQNWVVAYQQEWFTPDTSCQASGRGSGPETEGLVLLTRRTMSAPAFMPLTDSRIGLQTTVADAYALPVLVTHLTSGSSAGTTRAQQIDRLVAWARGFGEPRVLMGDFNAGPDGPELQPLFSGYRDAWTDALQMGRAIGTGNSKGSSRVDYIFYAAGGALTLESAEVVDTAAAGVQASDHLPILATFTVR